MCYTNTNTSNPLDKIPYFWHRHCTSIVFAISKVLFLVPSFVPLSPDLYLKKLSTRQLQGSSAAEAFRENQSQTQQKSLLSQAPANSELLSSFFLLSISFDQKCKTWNFFLRTFARSIDNLFRVTLSIDWSPLVVFVPDR